MSALAGTSTAYECGFVDSAVPLAGEDPRSRLLAATLATVGEHGYAATTTAEIAVEAGVSDALFATNFPDKETCYLATYDALVEWLGAGVSAALSRRGGWPWGARIAVEATLGMIAEDPRLARVCGTEPLLAGAPALERHRATVRRLAEPLRAGREHCAWGAELPDQLEETVVSGAIWSIASRARSGGGERLLELAPELTYFLLTPYLDAAEARRFAGLG
jgi:AcrR family transcriptional regulator